MNRADREGPLDAAPAGYGNRVDLQAPLDAAAPARYGAYLAMVTGAAMFVLGLYFLFEGDNPIPLAVSFLIGGFLETVFGWFTLRRNRAAWAFACALHGSAGVVFLFGAPRVRDSLEVSIGAALFPSFLFGLLLILYVLGRHDF